MTVSIEIVGALLRPRGQRELCIDVQPGTTVGTLLTLLGYRQEHIPYIMVAADGSVLHHDNELSPDTGRLVLSTLVGGG